MLDVEYRAASLEDVPAMARVRGADRGSKEAWETRIELYLKGEHHPQKALMLRVAYVAERSDAVIGFVAGHLTRRYDCDGELEWIDVLAEHRGQGIARRLLQLLAKWFVEHRAARICVDPGNDLARRFYAKHGAKNLNRHWMIWQDIQSVLGE